MISLLLATTLVFARQDLPKVFLDTPQRYVQDPLPPLPARAFVRMPDPNIANDPAIEIIRTRMVSRMYELDHAFQYANNLSASYDKKADSLKMSWASSGSGFYASFGNYGGNYSGNYGGNYRYNGYGNYGYNGSYRGNNYGSGFYINNRAAKTAALAKNTIGLAYKYRRKARVLKYQYKFYQRQIEDINEQTGRSIRDFSPN
jgi:hypothetical protein